jgi:hypothetical protein
MEDTAAAQALADAIGTRSDDSVYILSQGTRVSGHIEIARHMS